MWEKFLEEVMDVLKDGSGTIVDFLVNWVKQNLLAPNVVKNMETGVEIYNGMLANTIDMLTTNPMKWNADGWNLIVTEVYPVFLIVACPLVVVFSLMNFCSETSDLRMSGNTRPDRIIPLLVKLSLAEFVTVNALWLVCALFGFVDLLTGGWIKRNIKMSAMVGFTEAEVSDLPGLLLLVTYLVSLVYMVVLIIIAAVILYTATVRFYKILTLIPVGSLASSTIGGSREVSQTAVHFWKYMISVVGEAVLMILILTLFSTIQDSLSIVSLSGDYRIIGIILNRMLMGFLCLGSIKGAGSWLQRATGF